MQLLRAICYATVAAGVLAIATALPYQTIEGMTLAAIKNGAAEFKPDVPNGIPDWEECKTKCLEDAACSMFVFFNALDSVIKCQMYTNTIGYGPLAKDNAITGQLDSSAPNASLVWLGTGVPVDPTYPYQIGVYLVGAPNITTEECQAECDEIETAYGAACVAYLIMNWGTPQRCFKFSSAFTELPTEVAPAWQKNPRIGIRSDLTVTQAAVAGDTLETRVEPNDFPPAPPNIGAAVPNYTEIPFFLDGGPDYISSINGVFGDPSPSWQDCSVVCHRNVTCRAFLFKSGGYKNDERCIMYDAVYFGRIRPGYDKYGIIDRSKGEGAVSHLVDANNMGDLPNALPYKLFSTLQTSTMDDCARICYNFHLPKLCATFYFKVDENKCYLFDAALPCGRREALSFAGRSWDSAKHRFGYLNGRVPDEVIQDANSCFNPPTRRRHGDVQVFSHTVGKVVQGSAPRQVILVTKSLGCALKCHTNVWCVSYDYNEVSMECRLFELSVGVNSLAANASTAYVATGGVFNNANGN